MKQQAGHPLDLDDVVHLQKNQGGQTIKTDPWPPFPAQPDCGQRRYSVSDERLPEFAKLTVYERLKWVEECSTFVRLGQQAMARQASRKTPA